MGMIRKLAVATGCTALWLGSAQASEITGNGKILDVHGKSSCAYSGLNDTPDGDEATSDPGGRVQSYGYFHSQTWLGDFISPKLVSPREFGPHPGYACNPNSDPPFPVG